MSVLRSLQEDRVSRSSYEAGETADSYFDFDLYTFVPNVLLNRSSLSLVEVAVLSLGNLAKTEERSQVDEATLAHSPGRKSRVSAVWGKAT